jgi:hypothetical protein
MGQKHGNSIANPMATERKSLSGQLSENRLKHKSLMVNMTKRVLESEIGSRKLEFLVLPEAAVAVVISFLLDDLRTLMSVSPAWFVRILEAVDSIFSPIESHFSVVYAKYLVFKKSFLSTGRIQVVGRSGKRVDRVIIAETLPNLKGLTMKLRFTYRTYHDKCIYSAEYKFDVSEKLERTVWAHRDESKVHSEENLKAYTLQIPMICPGDNLEFAVNWLNLSSAVRLDSIQWQAPVFQETRLQISRLQLKYDLDRTKKCEGIEHKTYMYNIARHCEVQLSQVEWYKPEYYTKANLVFAYDYFLPFMRCVKTKFAGVDLLNAKFEYLVEYPGIVPGSLEKIGILIEVRERDEELTNEVKRLGLFYDRHKQIEMRVGDRFVLYITR